jgi:hypothetical protein
MSKYYKGRYKPKFPEKYKGDPSNVVYRSSWELNCMTYFDKNPDIIWWASEELIIPYRSPIDGRKHRYFPDFIIKTKNKEVIVIEVKPLNQTSAPKPQKKLTKKYLTEVQTWGVNQAKWKAANEYCLDRGWKFTVVTEKQLFGKKPK